MATTFHDGELNVQRQAGVQHMASRVGRGIRDSIPLDWADFLREQNMAGVASIDGAGQVWASVLIGEPGFIDPLDGETVQFNTRPIKGDPLEKNLIQSHPMGLLVINLAERQRMRVNGHVNWTAERELQLTVEQVFGNCPKYIQARLPERASYSLVTPDIAIHSARLTPIQQGWITQADTFFIASAHAESGADISHRGGNPGFVHVVSDSLLEFPDYSGNMMFNTLGNLTANPNAGLLFMGFEQGYTLQLTGQATIHWDDARKAAFPGAERVIAYQVREVVEIAQAIPVRFRLLERSRHNPA